MIAFVSFKKIQFITNKPLRPDLFIAPKVPQVPLELKNKAQGLSFSETCFFLFLYKYIYFSK